MNEAITLGEHTRRALARILEQTGSAVLVAAIEAAGHDPAAGWSLALDGARLVRTGPPQQGAAAPLEGGSADGAVAPVAGASG